MAAASSSSQQQAPQVRFQSQRNTSKAMVSLKLYDAFINHRGPDVKHTLALLLHKYIQDGNCRAFLDSREFEAGDSIPSTLRDAIRSSSVQIAIFTKGYADSVWCLDELVLMLQQTKALFIPVFYGVQPWELRYIENGVYADAFNKLEKKGRYPSFLIHQWRGALYSASKISGYDFNNINHNDEKLCKELVKEEEIVNGGDNPIKGICHCTKEWCKDIATAVVKVVERTRPLPVAKSPVGLDVLVQDFETQVFKDMKEKANIIGIFGMGGIGKTTLSKEFFNRRRSEYSAACFLFDVREVSTKGELPSLQSKLLKHLFSEDDQLQHIDEGYSRLSSRLERCDPDSTFLIVLDDVDNEDQLNSLFPRDRLTWGSLVVVTTRDERVLKRAKITCQYNLKAMDLDNSTELFCQHAFGTSGPAIGYEDLVKSFVECCGGLPLSLQVLGSHVYGGDKHYWQWELTKVRNILPGEIRQMLKISIDALDSEEQQIFMDIACFFIFKEEDMAMTIWKGSGWNAEHALETLKDRSLVTVKKEQIGDYEEFGFVLGMHDHVRDLGREMADEQMSPSRQWHPKHLKSLEGKNFQNILDESCSQNLRCLHTISEDNSVYKKNSVSITYFLGNVNDCPDTKTSLLWLSLRQNYMEEQTTVSPSCLLWLPLRELWLHFRHNYMEEQTTCLLWLRLSEFWLHLRHNYMEEQTTVISSYLLWLRLHVYGMEEQTTVFPSWFPSQNLQCLSISGGRFKKMWQTDRMAPFQLKKLRLDDCGLEDFSCSSLRMLSQLEELELTGEFSHGEPFCIEGRSFSESLRHLSKLKSLVLRDLTLNGELAFHKSRDPESPMMSLGKIEILNVNLLEKVSVSLEHCPSLQSLILQDLDDLIEVDLSPSCYELRPCKNLPDLARNSEEEEFLSLKRGCTEEEGFLYLEGITIKRCWKLHHMTGIEKMKISNFLLIEAGNGGIRNCIQRLQRVPSDGMTVIGKAVDGAKSKLNANLFAHLIGFDAVFEFYKCESHDWKPQPQPQPLSAVFVCGVVERRGYEGDWIITTVLPEEKEIASGWKWASSLFVHETKKGCIVTVNTKEEWKAMDILKTIINQLHE